jgi:hypothetical protein
MIQRLPFAATQAVQRPAGKQFAEVSYQSAEKGPGVRRCSPSRLFRKAALDRLG